MRYTVRYASSRYLGLVERFVQDPDFVLPEGVYRGLDVVVEAEGPEEALRLAAERLGWPDDEMSLVPFGITNGLAARAGLESMRDTLAIFQMWREAGFFDGHEDMEATLGIPPPR